VNKFLALLFFAWLALDVAILASIVLAAVMP
jgi:hypothetical protein